MTPDGGTEIPRSPNFGARKLTVKRLANTYSILLLTSARYFPGKFINFKLFAYYEEVEWYTASFIVFMAYIKFLRMLRFNHHVKQFAETLRQAAPNLLSFSIMFLVLFMAFTSSGYLLFHKEMLDYRTVISVMESLYSMLIGKFDVHEMEQADR